MARIKPKRKPARKPTPKRKPVRKPAPKRKPVRKPVRKPAPKRRPAPKPQPPPTGVPLTARERRQMGAQRRLAREHLARIQSREWRSLVDRVHAAEARARRAERELAAVRQQLEAQAVRPRPLKPRPEPPPRPRGAVYTEERLDELIEDVADQWGVPIETAEELVTGLATPDIEDVTAYIDDLWERLTEEGEDIDVSDLWDMYYGYEPGLHGR